MINIDMLPHSGFLVTMWTKKMLIIWEGARQGLLLLMHYVALERNNINLISSSGT